MQINQAAGVSQPSNSVKYWQHTDRGNAVAEAFVQAACLLAVSFKKQLACQMLIYPSAATVYVNSVQ